MPLQPMIAGARHMAVAGHYLATEAPMVIHLWGGADPRRAARAMGW